ncbi:hypothetical protein BegalDRAFT_2825 [Beggiatoa alba B18LD]|uniref:Lipoprotein n=1 Tax=Beggiatoa alba B18LD TaxID=395493 RepID=I3CJ66_9GAMM|nr:hypothetical protein [Beggiatoa alba]EIJ43659.1 hypothetical protein BegalDRAFT_2825 [Beggiatoa alba B18LD]
MCVFNKPLTFFIFMLVVSVGYACNTDEQTNPLSCSIEQKKPCIFVSQQIAIIQIKTNLGNAGGKYCVRNIPNLCQKNDKNDYINCLKTAIQETTCMCRKKYFLGLFNNIYILILPNQENSMETSLDDIMKKLQKTN